jgi:asparagine synthase (glutamine-hydrolysing)
MCGIVGFLYADPARAADAAAVTAMRDVFPYRGPDDAGLHLDGPMAMGHRRLSIIDLGGGHQPMTHGDGRYWIVFNGEIYNYRRLREDLLAAGHQFRTSSDTEVILQWYEREGEAAVMRLNGMFAFAIWDARDRTLFLARDRMGVKPLYYADTPDGFVFASEIKAILASGLVPVRRRDDAVAEYLLFRQVSGEDTMFEGVRSLPPGCTMTRSPGRGRLSRYWSPVPPAEREPISYAQATQELARLLEESVRMRMVSDVPLGTFCSGGVDSSLVTAIAAKAKGEPVNTYSIGFDEPDYDESRFATMVSRHCGTIHHELRVGNEEFSRLLPQLVWHNDEPLNFANSVQIFALSRLAREQVIVVLTGEGADELFAGYPRYRIPGLARRYRRVPRLMRRWLSAGLGDHRFEKLDRFAGIGPDEALLYNTSFLAPDVLCGVCPGLRPPSLEFRRASLDRSRQIGLDEVARLSLLDQDTYLVSILHRQDKMSMAASIESRVPFMDYRMVELANRLPTAHKIRHGSSKAIVKDVARAWLPTEVVYRRKSGFGVPLDRWFRANDGLGARLRDLAEQAPPEIFDRSALRRAVSEHRAGTRDHSDLLWATLNLCLWREAFPC